jgi:DNA-binding response OmpR family regulator
VRRGPVSMRALMRLQEDARVELFVADELTTDWISFARRVAGTLVATEGDPLSALGYIVTAGMMGPIIVAMPSRFKTDCKDLIAAGALACVTMPISKADVDRLIPMLLRQGVRAPARMDATLRLLLDPISREVRYRDRRVRLSQREFAVLHCLSGHEGRPVSAEKLLTYVWGDADSGERSRQILDVYIFQLRKKLERLSLKGAIATVRGFGYALAQCPPTI